jgi:hypothetical protein
MFDADKLSFHPELLRYWLRAILLAEQIRKPRLWIEHNNTSFKRTPVKDVLASLAKDHFPPDSLRFTPARMVNGLCHEAPALTLTHREYRVTVRPAYTDRHGVSWQGALTFELFAPSRLHRRADVRFSVKFDVKGKSRKPSLYVTPALDRLDNPTEADLPALNELSELLTLLQNNGNYRVMLDMVYDLVVECYGATDDKPAGLPRLKRLLNKP